MRQNVMPLFAFMICSLFVSVTCPLHGQATPPPPQSPPAAATGVAPLDVTALGFHAGETRAEIIAAFGKDAVKKSDGDFLEIATPAGNTGQFDNYLLVVSAKEGLVKVVATGRDIDDDANGAKMRAAFAQMKTDLQTTYGEPSDHFDFVKSGSKLKGADDFMMALTKTERVLSCYWTKRDFGNQVISIEMEANGLGSATGYVTVEYEFAPYRTYLSRKK